MRLVTNVLAMTLTLAAAVGCEEGPEVVPVSGVVTVDNKPLAGAHINTQPVGTIEAPNPGEGSFGITDEEGRYTLELVSSGDPGAVVGEHRVTIVMKEDAHTDNPSDDRYRPPSRRLPPHFSDGSLQITVPAGGTESADLELSSSPRR